MRRTVKITNKTDFDSRNLRSLILAVARRELKPTQYKNIEVTVGYPKSKFCTSLAYINPTGSTATFTIFIPKDQVDVVEVCHRIKVCFDYCLGRHGTAYSSFRDWYQRPGKASDYPFAKKYTMVKATVKTSQKLTGAAGSLKKAEYAQEKVHYLERKIKYANTMLRKWKKQLRYHSSRGERLQAEEATALESRGMTVEDFYKGQGEGEEQ
jgi:hypothetical protein